MANNQGEGFGDDLFEQIVLQVPGYTTTTTTGGGLEPTGFLGFRGGLGGGGRGGSNEAPSSSSSSSSSMMLGLGSSTGDGPSGHHHHHHQRHGLNVGLGVGVGGGFRGLSLPLGLNLDHGVAGNRFGDGGDGAINVSSSSSPRISDGDTVNFTNLFPAFGPIQPHFLRPVPPPASIQLHPQPSFQGHAAAPPQPSRAAPHAPGIRPRVRARRGQATDPHSIAERLRRERIAERMKALQELVPSCNKTDRAAMLDEIVDYVKFLKLQVKVLSMSRLGGAGAVAQLVADVPTTSSIEGLGGGGMEEQPAWEKWSNDGTEQQVARLMDQDIGAAMQLLQSKSLCIMPISVASTMFPAHPPPVSDSTTPTIIKPESGHP